MSRDNYRNIHGQLRVPGRRKDSSIPQSVDFVRGTAQSQPVAVAELIHSVRSSKPQYYPRSGQPIPHEFRA